MNQESEVIFDSKYEDLSNEIKPLIDDEYSNKFQELYVMITNLPYNIYSRYTILRDIQLVLGTKLILVRTDKNLKEKIRKCLGSNILFLKGTNEDVKKCYKLTKELLDQMFIEDAKFKDVQV